jgi:hypothetical protein
MARPGASDRVRRRRSAKDGSSAVTTYRIGAMVGLVAMLAACSFRPQIGMSFEDWNRQCRSKALSGGTLLERKGATDVYYCGTQDVLYSFENGALAEVKSQPAYQSGAGVKLIR